MARVILAGLIALIASIVVGPRFIRFLRHKEIGEHIRDSVGTPGSRGVWVDAGGA